MNTAYLPHASIGMDMMAVCILLPSAPKTEFIIWGNIVRLYNGVQTVLTEPQLSEIGRYAYEQFMNVKTHYPYAEIPLFVVMPNHIHAIVMIDGNHVPYNCS